MSPGRHPSLFAGTESRLSLLKSLHDKMELWGFHEGGSISPSNVLFTLK